MGSLYNIQDCFNPISWHPIPEQVAHAAHEDAGGLLDFGRLGESVTINHWSERVRFPEIEKVI